MERISGPGATTDHKFTEGDPSLGIPATTVTGNWLNGIQEELMNIIEQTGLTPSQEDLGQVLTALRAIFIQKDVETIVPARNLVEILAVTGHLPSNGVYSWGSLFVSESTAGTAGSADNELYLVANAYRLGTEWKRRAGGPSIGLKFSPSEYAIHFMDGGSGSPDDTITWTARGRVVLNGQTVLTNLTELNTASIAANVALTPWIGLVVNITVALETKKQPDNTLHVVGSLYKADGVSISTGLEVGYIAGNLFDIEASKKIYFSGVCDGVNVVFHAYYNTTTTRTTLVADGVVPSTGAKTVYFHQVVPAQAV